jgi:XTP/dITP diphosphohydrolase
MKKIVFATNNQHKLDEVRHILGQQFEVLSLADIGCHEDIPENGQTLMENAALKAKYVYDHYHIDCFADDTGLFVDALDGEPGIYSARYASMNAEKEGCTEVKSHDSKANMELLLKKLGDSDNRKARFCTIFALIRMMHGLECVFSVQFFQGTVEGEIIHEPRGNEGFGYDPIFQPEGYTQTFAEMGEEEKNKISHRARATAKLCKELQGATGQASDENR